MTDPLDRNDGPASRVPGWKAWQHGPVAWMAGNSVASNILMLVLLAGGVMGVLRIKQEFIPDFDLDVVRITVPYPGASPEEVEQAIVLVVEEAVRSLDGVDEVRSSSREGRGTVNVELLLGADNQRVTQEIKQEVDRIVSFPEESEEPQVVLVTRRRRVLTLVLYGDQNEHVLRELAEQTRNALLALPDITQVELGAVRPVEISIEVSQENLRKYNLTLDQVAQQVRRASVELPGGGMKTRGGEILMRMTDRRDYGHEFADIPIVSTADGSQVLLGDIADVVDGFADIDNFATYNGKPAVILDVYRVGDQTPISVSDAVRKYMAGASGALPPGVGMAIPRDMSDIYRQRMDLLIRNGRIGLVLVLVLLAVFLEARLAFWVTMGIPISFLGAFLILPAVGVSLNMVSMFAFIIALGIVVDDAIVVGENVYRYHQQGVPFLAAAMRGAREVALPVTFSILTNIVTFMPLFFIPGTMGKIFWSIPAVVVLVFTISLIECMFVLPAHLGHHRDRRRRGIGGAIHRAQRAFSDWFSRTIRTVYGPFLKVVLRHRYLMVSSGLAVLATIVGYVFSGRMGMTTFPKIESDRAVATAVLPYGTSVEVTKQVRDRLLRAAEQVVDDNGNDKLTLGIFAQVGVSSGGSGPMGAAAGGSGGHITEITMYLTRPENRPMSTAEVVRLWRKKVGQIAGVESLVFASDRGGPGSGAAMTIELSHHNVAVLDRAGAELADSLERFPEVKDIDDGYSPGKQQFDFKLRPEGRSLGLTSMEVARQVRSCYYGAEAFRQQRGRNEVKVMVRLPKRQRVNEYSLEEMLLRAPSGIEAPLGEVVYMSRNRAYTTIDRRDGQRTVSVTADVERRSQAGQVLAALRKNKLPELVAKYPGLSWEFRGRQEDMKESLSSLKSGFILAVIGIYVLLAIPFRSYVQPAIIMVSIPFGIVGAVFGHIVMGYSLSVMSMMGIVALSGVVVNDALILIEFANRRRRDGLTPHDAVHEAGIRRFRPIMLTTLTTFGGLAPMIFETSRQARFLIPMALSLGYGILGATVISLLLVPSLFLIAEDVRRLFHPHRHGEQLR